MLFPSLLPLPLLLSMPVCLTGILGVDTSFSLLRVVLPPLFPFYSPSPFLLPPFHIWVKRNDICLSESGFFCLARWSTVLCTFLQMSWTCSLNCNDSLGMNILHIPGHRDGIDYQTWQVGAAMRLNILWGNPYLLPAFKHPTTLSIFINTYNSQPSLETLVSCQPCTYKLFFV